MRIAAYTRPPSHFSRGSARGLSARSLSEVIKGRVKNLTANPVEPWTCSHCRKNKHAACVSLRCACGKEHL